MDWKDTVMTEEELALYWRNPEDCDDVGIATTQAEVSFKMGQKEVVMWLRNNFEPTVPMSLEYTKWHRQLKRWGIDA